MITSKPLISEATKNSLTALIAEKAQTPKPLTTRQLIVQNKVVLRKMLKNGHSCSTIAGVLVEHGLTVSFETIEEIFPRKRKKGEKNKELSKAAAAEAELTVTQAQAESVIAEWNRLSEVRVGFTKQELVAELAPEIDAALKAGYTYEAVAQMLTIKGVKIATGSLRKYHRAIGAETSQASHKTDKATAAAIASANTVSTASVPLTSEDDIFAEDYSHV